MDKFKKRQNSQQDQQAAIQSILQNKQSGTKTNEIIEITQQDIDKYAEGSLIMRAIRSFIKGFIFGFQFRLVYAIFMYFFFKIDRPILKSLRQTLFQTIDHAFLLGQHCFLFQIVFGLMNKLFKDKKRFNGVVTGFVIGLLLYKDKTFVKKTILLYMLSRGLYASGTKLQQTKVFPKIKFWPYLAAFCWGLTMFFYETDRTTLAKSVEQSLKYLLNDENQGRQWFLPKDVPKILEKALLI